MNVRNSAAARRQLTEREKDCLRRVKKGDTYRLIAVDYGLSKNRIRQIVYVGMRKICWQSPRIHGQLECYLARGGNIPTSIRQLETQLDKYLK